MKGKEEEFTQVEENRIYSEDEPLDFLRLYLREIKATELLTAEEERELAARIAQGDEGARRRMIESNLRLVVKVTKGYRGQGLPLLDLIEEGNIGLIKAVERFRPEKNCRFSTYAMLWIRQSIERALVNQTRTVKLPAHVIGDMKRMIRVSRSLTQRLGREPLLEEVVQEMGVKANYVNHLMMAVRRVISIDAALNERGDRLLVDTLQAEERPGPFSITEHVELFKLISSWLDLLSPQEKTVIDLRFGLRDGDPKTLEAIGAIFGVTRERIRQIEVKALQRLRKVMEEKDVILLEHIKG